jgi:hypothetical protein
VQVRCVKAFGYSKPGDVAEVPDGASADPEHWEPVTAPAKAPVPDLPVIPVIPKEGT